MIQDRSAPPAGSTRPAHVEASTEPITPEQIEQAEALLRDATWLGHSGEPVTGEQAAHHLETALTLVEETGWNPRSGRGTRSALDGVDEKTTLGIARGILRWLREEMRPTPPHTLWRAMLQVAEGPDGDDDTRAVAEQCLMLVLRARTGALTVYPVQWEERRGRTWDELRDAVTVAARIARHHGPQGGAH